MDHKPATDLALEYFKIGNAVVAFYVVQTLIFLNAIYKETKLLGILHQNRQTARRITWGIAGLYIFVVVGCGILEVCLRNSLPALSPMIPISTYVASAGRVAVISALAWGCAQLIDHLNELPTSP